MKSVTFSMLMNMDVEVSIKSAGLAAPSVVNTTRFVGEGRKSNLLCALLAGERQYRANDKPAFSLSPGELLFIPTTSCYLSVATEKGTSWYYVDFNLFSDGEELYITEPFRVMRDEACLEGLRAVVECGQSKLRAKSAMLTLLAGISERDRAADIERGGFSSIYEAILAIEQHPEREFSVSELARRCFLSDTGFREKFKRFTGGLAPMAYRTKPRLERADALLGTGTLSLDEIAETLGFWDTAHFCRVYKKLRGHTPTGKFK
ncbi:MAG: helix-turn-helix transcriptional regulator [Ruminococcaceae bacterium]|nr:helix-turn-helix transcriptional regulator [Oscillospiraceae bacterium]